MILQTLTAYYEALLAQGRLSAPGWADAFPVSYELEVDDRGALIDVIDCRENMLRGKKTVLAPRQMRVPADLGFFPFRSSSSFASSSIAFNPRGVPEVVG